MPKTATQTLTGCLSGSPRDREELLALVYDDLQGLAKKHLAKERAGHTLQPTALVHEAYVRLIEPDGVDVTGKTHFLALAASTMRRVLVDHARARLAQKRGAGAGRVTLRDSNHLSWDSPEDVLALHEALEALGQRFPRPARVVELRFLGGLTVEQTAEAMELGRDTVMSDWKFARAWLNRALGGDVDA